MDDPSITTMSTRTTRHVGGRGWLGLNEEDGMLRVESSATLAEQKRRNGLECTPSSWTY